MKMKVILKTIGWLLILTLGVIHFLNSQDLSVLNSGWKGIIYNVSVVIGLALMAFSSSPKMLRESKTAVVLLSAGLVLFFFGIIWSGVKGYNAITFFVVFFSMGMIITADFIGLRREAECEK